MQKDDYKHNHYVPVWYQKRFLQPGSSQYYRLDMSPDPLPNVAKNKFRDTIHFWSPKRIFAEDDLYTTRFGSYEDRSIEKFFFGALDNSAPRAVEEICSFNILESGKPDINNLLLYMSVQKLRTPKGLKWLSAATGGLSGNALLVRMQMMSRIFCAIWTEAIWQIADASESTVKFIVSDHPVTVYNRACPPGSSYCGNAGDPDIRMHATHTYLPLSLDKILILTNLSWLRNPYQSEKKLRPNPNFSRPAIMKLLQVQTERKLSEQEVLQINYITKRRAFRYIAGSEENWLFPEKYLTSTHWKNFGDGYLFMPDPRHLHMGGEVYIGYKDGTTEAFGAYGHRPWQRGFADKKREDQEWATFERFKSEFAFLYGPKWRGRTFEFPRRRVADGDSAEMYEHYLERHRKFRRKNQ